MRFIAALTFLFAFAPVAHGYQLKRDSTGAVVRWPGEVHFVVDAQADRRLREPQAFVAIQAAVDALNATGTALEVHVEAGQTTGVGYDLAEGAVNRNEIVVLDEWEYDESAIAVTVVTLNVTRHEIIDADIAFNAEHRRFKALPPQSRPDPASEFDDVQNTFTHELGHAVGLAHNADVPEAVMYPGARRGEVHKRVVSADDRAGLLELYGQPAPQPVDGATPEEMAAGCSATSGSPLHGLSALAALALALRGRRRASVKAKVVGAVLGATLAVGSSAAWASERGGAHLSAAGDLSRSDVVLTAEVISAEALPPAPGARVLRTELRLRVRECVKGDCGSEVRLVVPGGRVGDIEQVVEDHPVPSFGDVIALARTQAPTVRGARMQLYRLGEARDFVRFAKALLDAGLTARLADGVSEPTSRSEPTLPR